MEQSLHATFKKALATLAFFLLLQSSFAQSAPELVFKNPMLEQGVDGEDGAVYRFSNITNGTDGLLKIKRRSDAAVVLEDIDVTGTGWDKALQPRLGVSGYVLADQTWWMQFELTFVQHNTTKKIKLNHFVATPIDVDGDNVAIREFLQMDQMKAIAYSAHTVLKNGPSLPEQLFSAMNNDSNSEGCSADLSKTDSRIVGPVTSFADIDTAATAVMATYTYENKDAITFFIGATSTGAVTNPGMVGLRLNSIWFKSFNLTPQETLPVALETFAVAHSSKAITLKWKTAGEQNVSHFVVERSVNGRTYSGIALIPAMGSVAGRTYSYKEKEVVTMPAGIVYYRLRLVDNHRSASYSSVSAVHAKESKKANKIVVLSNATESSIGILGKAKRKLSTLR